MLDNRARRVRAFVESSGKRWTVEREVVVNAVFSLEEPFGIDQVVAQVASRTKGRGVSRATVYRVLDTMVSAGLLRKTTGSTCPDEYEYEPG